MRRGDLARELAANRAPVPRPELTAAVADCILKLLARGHTIVHCCDVAGISRTAFYLKRNTDQEFSGAVEEAMLAGTQALEEECRRRGMDGVTEPVLHQGAICYHTDPVTGALILDPETGKPMPILKRTYSDNLLMFTAKARDRARYADRHEITGADGGPVETADISTARSSIAERINSMSGRLVFERETVRERITVTKPNGKGNGHG